MNEKYFHDNIIPIVDSYWEYIDKFKINFENSTYKIGKMIIFYCTSFIPDAILIFDDNDVVIDGFISVDRQYMWSDKLVSDILEELNNEKL